MCFSAEASFGSAAVLVPAGVYCFWVASRRERACFPLAALPMIFSVQQFCEGLVWVGLDRGDAALVKIAAPLFLFFALAFWLFWVPFSVLVIEPRRGTRWFLSAVALVGLVFGLFLFTPMALDPDQRLRVSVVHHSIQYESTSLPVFRSVPGELWQLLYLAIVFSPLVVSSYRRFRFFTIMLVISSVISYLMFWYAFISVWCFFAAVLSLQLCHVLRQLPESGAGVSEGSAPEPGLVGHLK